MYSADRRKVTKAVSIILYGEDRRDTYAYIYSIDTVENELFNIKPKILFWFSTNLELLFIKNNFKILSCLLKAEYDLQYFYILYLII